MENKRCFIIAEAGVNHNGDIGLAYKLIDAAKEAGVDCIKFQTFKTEKVISKNTEMASYQKENLQNKFDKGIVFYAGDRAVKLDEDMFALPFSCMG